MLKRLQTKTTFPEVWQQTWVELQPLHVALTELAEPVASDRRDESEAKWPTANLDLLTRHQVFRWCVPRDRDGWAWSEQQILAGYLAICQSCLTTAFILTQWNAACRRIVQCQQREFTARLLPRLAAGELMITVGISHLSTSRQHLGRPMLTATAVAGGYRLNGLSPWVTGAAFADWIVLGATLEDGREILALAAGQQAGLSPNPGMKLMALSGSCTDSVAVNDLFIPAEQVIAGPVEHVMRPAPGAGSGTGGLQTSGLAMGLTLRGIEFLYQQAEDRNDLFPIADKFLADAEPWLQVLWEVAEGQTEVNQIELRTEVNSLVLRVALAGLQASKGAGYVVGHPANQTLRESLFFLLWSCPQAVIESNLCDLAGIDSIRI